jgi:hypothetical protein
MGSAMLLLLLSASGDHMRLSTSRGPVHVLIQPQSSLTVVYVHGCWTTVDDAWVQHRLPEQLLGSGLDATFIVPEAPAGPGDEIAWPDLEDLLQEVESRGVKLPGPVIAAGHSGAVYTLSGWTASPRVQAFVLLDAFYGGAEVWERWLDANADGQLFVLAHTTQQRSDPFCRRRASDRVHCSRVREGHMQMITRGRTLPEVLRAATQKIGAALPLTTT